MPKIEGFNLVDNASPVTRHELPAGKVDYQLVVKYIRGGNDRFDISKIIKVGKYNEDIFSCEVHLTPGEYEDLIEFIEDATELRIEFTIGVSERVRKQYIITEVTKYPNRPDDMMEARATTTFTLLSRYYNVPALVTPP